MCISVCPVRAITMADTAKIDIDRCTGCGACAGVCKKGAIIEVPAETEMVHRSTVMSGVTSATENAIKQHGIRSHGVAGSCRRGWGMGRGGRRGMKRQKRRK